MAPKSAPTIVATSDTLTLAGGAPVAEPEPAVALARDVVLQRAVDVLKGIRVYLSWQ